MEIHTLCDVFYHAVDHFQKAEHLKYKRDGEWRSISSQDFCRAVEELSLGLRSMGVEKGDRVAILSENRPEWAFADLATLTAAAVDVPIYATLTPAQVLYILNDSQAKVLFVSTEAQGRKVAEIRGKAKHLRQVIKMNDFPLEGAISLDETRAKGRAELEREPEAVRRRALEARPEDLATLIYTSGTTGDPKGVMLTHGNLVFNVKAGCASFRDMSSEDVSLSFLPLCHVFERMAGYYLMLMVGATIAYAEGVDQVAANMSEVHPTLMSSVPRLYEKMYARVLEKVAKDPPLRRKIFQWAVGVGREMFAHRVRKTRPGLLLKLKHALADRLVFSKIRERTGGRLKLFVSGGAPLAKEIAEFFGAVGLLILEGYGLTETSPIISVNLPDDMKPGSVGKPVPGVEVKIAEDGEILTRGPHVMRGYYGKPEATAEAIDADGWFHTGDVGVLDAQGFLTITDRKKDIIVTSGGKNIAPQPIENLLKTNPLIAEVVMIGNRRHYPSALLVPNFENLERWAKEKGIVCASHEELAAKDEVVALFEGVVRQMTGDLAQFEKIKKITLLPREFSLEAGELTPTLKVKRRFVEEKYRTTIDAMYDATAGAAEGAHP